MESVLLLLTGCFITLIVTSFLYPVASRIEQFSRRFWHIRPCDIDVEDDPSIIWAGRPPWVGATVWLPSTPGKPPEICTDWHAWAQENEGADVGLSILEVTIQARKGVSLLVKGVKVRQRTPSEPEQIGGYIYTCPVGGAAIAPRRIEIDLNWPGGGGVVSWRDQSGNHIDPLQVTLSSGEVEQFQIWVKAERGRHDWWLELVVLVDGRREIIPIPDKGKHFTTIGPSGMPKLAWREDHWDS
jgi:hypothetical protein